MQSRRAAKLSMMVALGAASSVLAVQAQEGALLDHPLPNLSRDDVALLDGSMERVLQEFAIPGMAVGIVENGKPVYIRGFGVRDTRKDQAVDTHTMFHVASFTRTFTATAVLQLVERGQLGLSDSIAGSSLTVQQSLTRDDAAFDALAGIVATASGQDYLQYMQTSVLDAAGMQESTFDAPLVEANVAWPHRGKVFVRPAQRYPWSEQSLPSAGLSASIADVTRWAALNVTHDSSLLTAASFQTMVEPLADRERDGMSMSLGWQLERRGDEWLPRYAARGPGFSTFVTLFPKQQRAIVILSNGETTPGEQMRGVIERILAGKGYVLPKPSLLLRSDFRWAFGGLVGMSLLLVAVSVRYRRLSARTSKARAG